MNMNHLMLFQGFDMKTYFYTIKAIFLPFYWGVQDVIIRIKIFFRFYALRTYLKRQVYMLYYWNRKQSKRQIFGTTLDKCNGEFTPSLADVISGRAKKRYYGK